MVKEEVLELKTRRKIYNYILKNPGLHERELSRKLKIPLGTLDYHLFYMSKKEIIIFKSDGKFTRYFIKGRIGKEDKKTISILRQKIFRKILIFLLKKPNSLHIDICNFLGCAKSTTTFHLKKLIKFEILGFIEEGRTVKYFIKDPDEIIKLLIIYQKSFFDDAVDRFIDTWVDLHPRQIKDIKEESKKTSLPSLFETLQPRQ